MITFVWKIGEIKRQESRILSDNGNILKKNIRKIIFYFIIGADSLFMFEQWAVGANRCDLYDSAAYRDDKNNRQVMEDKIAD